MSSKNSLKLKIVDWCDFIFSHRIKVESIFVLLAFFNMFLFPERTPDILNFTAGTFWPYLFWGGVVIGIGIRIWAAGNLRKNEQLSLTGPYQLIRHPLYLGSLIIYITLFLTLGNIYLGLGLFFVLLIVLYFPLMFRDERNMRRDFSEGLDEYFAINRIVPNPVSLVEAFRTEQFSVKRALDNSGFGSLWLIPGIALLYFLLQSFVLS